MMTQMGILWAFSKAYDPSPSSLDEVAKPLVGERCDFLAKISAEI